MKQKTMPIPCQYILDSINLTEISDAFNHHIDLATKGKLTGTWHFNTDKWTTIWLCQKDAATISQIVSGLEVNVNTIYGVYTLKIKVSDTMNENEIFFH